MYSRKWLWLSAVVGLALYADLPQWISTIELRSKLEPVFYRTVTFGANIVSWRRPPKETRLDLDEQVKAAPADAQLYYLRAREAESALDFAAAEADWGRYTQTAADKATAWREKADFHQRRMEPEKQLAALLEAAKAPSADAYEPYRPEPAQAAWATLEFAAGLVPEQLLSDDRAMAVWQAWEARYKTRPEPYKRELDWLVARQRWADVDALIGRYRAVFPADESWTLAARAAVERGQGNGARAVAIYEQSFRPDWSDAMVLELFNLLDQTGGRRAFVAAARAKLAAEGGAFDAAARLFLHYRAAADNAAAQRVLFDLNNARAGRFTPAEQLMLARYEESVQNLTGAARRYYAIYSGGDATSGEAALAALIRLLSQQADQPFRFGAGDLSFYRDIAQLDSMPGFWNGIVSLVLNGTSPAAELAEQERRADPYFHRAAAAELLRVLDTRFPTSARRAALHASVIQAAAIHAESDRVVKLGQAFLRAFSGVAERTEIALLTADAHARMNQTQQEFALYDGLLDELSSKADRVPIGEAPVGASGVARSPEYPRVLDRYIARLVAMKQPGQALALYRREMDRNPNDPGLYERLAAFLEQNRLGGEIEATYRKAMAQFADKSWSHKLARYFLRAKMLAKYGELTRDIASKFSGTELESYLNVTAAAGSVDPALFLQVNLYAMQRFPHHMRFVTNLLAAYSTKGTANPAEYEKLLRSHWMYDAGLRDRFFAYLAANKRLDAELAALQRQVNDNRPVRMWVAEAMAWQSHFETAAPLLRTVAEEYPSDLALGSRAAAMHRSLAWWEPKQLDTAIQLEETLLKAHPTDLAVMTRLGEMQADRERFDRATPFFDRAIATAPGKPDMYLYAATLHWDYYRFGDALARIADGRKRLNNARLYAFEAGAIYENQANLAAAAREYVAGAVEGGAASAAQQRLLKVATRPAWQPAVTAALQGASGNVLALRVALLESQGKRAELEAMLTASAANADAAALPEIRQHAQRSGLVNVERRVMERQLALADYPAARMQALAERMRFEESAGNASAAAQAAQTMLREGPRSMGVVRTSVNYLWRSGQQRQAAELLLTSAGVAYPELARQFRLEALRKFSEAGDYARVHAEAAKLLAIDPLDEPVLAAKADAYGRAKDDRALAAMYQQTIAGLQKLAPLPVDRIATVRRDWIPALLRLGDANGAADQYIELLKAYPEDEGLQGEAARFAAANGQRARVTSYFAKAETDSPKDARWPLVRARLEQSFGDYTAALAAWNRAAALRPERLDLLSSRASLEERMLQFDNAVTSYRKLYDQSFKNPAWLAEGARVLARQQKWDECVKWLREANIDNRPVNAENWFRYGEKLLEWGAVEQARVELAAGWAKIDENSNVERGSALLARAYAQARQLDQLTPVLESKVAVIGRDRLNGWRQGWMIAAAQTASAFYTPEEKGKFGTWLEGLRARAGSEAVATAAQQAGLLDVSARSYVALMSQMPGSDRGSGALENLAKLQNDRLVHGELARQLEAYYRVHPPNDGKNSLLARASSAYRTAMDDANELRLLNLQYSAGALGGEDFDRFFELTARRTPFALTAAQKADDLFVDSMANLALRRGSAPLAAQLVAGRRSALWQCGNRALAGLYFAENSPVVRKAFGNTLGPERIGERLALTGDAETQATGDIWFHYAGRYGAWLQAVGDASSPAYLAALVERRSNSAGAYIALGEESAAVAAEPAFRTALLLDAHQPIALARLGRLALARGDKAGAGALWRQAAEQWVWWQNNRRLPEEFWAEANGLMAAAGNAGLQAEVRDQVDTLVKAYVKRNGSYRVRELLEGVMAMSADGTAGVAWVTQIARAAADPAMFLDQVNRERWLPESGRDALLRQQVAFAVTRASTAIGEEREMARTAVVDARLRLAELYRERKQMDALRPLAMQLWANTELRSRYDVAKLRLRVAVADGNLDTVLPELPQESDFLLNQGNDLRRAGMVPAARAVLRAAYTAQLKGGNTTSAPLGLANLDLEEGATTRAVESLGVYTMQAETPFSKHLEAARLLLRAGRKEEALPLLEALTKAEPWNLSALQSLLVSREDAAGLEKLVADGRASYADRAQAARWLGGHGARKLSSGSGELDYLAAGAYADKGAEGPLWVEARLAAAEAAKDAAVKVRLYRGVLALSLQHSYVRSPLLKALAAAGRWREAATLFREQPWGFSAEDRPLLADALTRNNDLQRAMNLYFELFQSEEDPAKRVTWFSAAERVRLVVEREQQNENRRPVVQPELDETRKVRPRLVAATGGAR